MSMERETPNSIKELNTSKIEHNPLKELRESLALAQDEFSEAFLAGFEEFDDEFDYELEDDGHELSSERRAELTNFLRSWLGGQYRNITPLTQADWRFLQQQPNDAAIVRRNGFWYSEEPRHIPGVLRENAGRQNNFDLLEEGVPHELRRIPVAEKTSLEKLRPVRELKRLEITEDDRFKLSDLENFMLDKHYDSENVDELVESMALLLNELYAPNDLEEAFSKYLPQGTFLELRDIKPEENGFAFKFYLWHNQLDAIEESVDYDAQLYHAEDQIKEQPLNKISRRYNKSEGDIQIGELARTVYRRKDGRVYLNNDVLSIWPEFQQQGLGSMIHKAGEEFAKDNDLDGITLLANGTIGKYAWARAGFDFAYAEDLQVYRKYLKNTVEMVLIGESKQKEELMARIDSLNHSWEIADFNIDQKQWTIEIEGRKMKASLGKIAMLLPNSSWDGIKSLNPDSESYQVGYSYRKIKEQLMENKQ